MEHSLKVQTFFIMDENFLLHRERAMRTAGPHEEGGQELGDGGVRLGQCDSEVHGS